MIRRHLLIPLVEAVLLVSSAVAASASAIADDSHSHSRRVLLEASPFGGDGLAARLAEIQEVSGVQTAGAEPLQNITYVNGSE